MGTALQCVQGADRDFQLQATTDGVTPSTAMLGTDTLAARVWIGDDQPTLLTPTCEWIDATEARYLVSLTNTQTASLPIGTYYLQVTATRSGKVAILFNGSLEVISAPGEAAAPPLTYCSYEDMLILAPWIAQHQMLGVDQAGFLQQRVEARYWTDGIVLAHAPTTGFGRSLHEQMIMDWSGGGAGYNLTVRGYLEANKLLITHDLRRINAYYALYLVTSAQICPGDNQYSSQASRFYGHAMRISNLKAEFDLDGTGRSSCWFPLNIANTSWQ